jgi:hypothetical protein
MISFRSNCNFFQLPHLHFYPLISAYNLPIDKLNRLSQITIEFSNFHHERYELVQLKSFSAFISLDLLPYFE